MFVPRGQIQHNITSRPGSSIDPNSEITTNIGKLQLIQSVEIKIEFRLESSTSRADVIEALNQVQYR
jgi:hypothetical protein